jgi:hypothetical protein
LIYRGNFRARDARAINLIRLPNRWASRTAVDLLGNLCPKL